jgi:hypothetical protein
LSTRSSQQPGRRFAWATARTLTTYGYLTERFTVESRWFSGGAYVRTLPFDELLGRNCGRSISVAAGVTCSISTTPAEGRNFDRKVIRTMLAYW